MPLAIWQWQSSMSSKSCSNLCCIIDVLQSQMHKVLYLPLVAVEVCKLTPWGYMATVKKIISSMLLLWHSALIWKPRTKNTLGGISCVFPSLAKSRATDIWPLSMHIISLTLLWSQYVFCWIAQSVGSFAVIHLPEVLVVCGCHCRTLFEHNQTDPTKF